MITIMTRPPQDVDVPGFLENKDVRDEDVGEDFDVLRSPDHD